MNKCPMCEKELATYQVSRLGEDGGPQERKVGCAKENAMVASAGEGYPGAAHDRLTLNLRLRDLVNRWYGNACVIGACMGEDNPAAKAMLRCRAELCEATGEPGL